jgi:hypothetical protein
MGDKPLFESVDRHNPIALYARGRHWVECSCGWLTKAYGRQVGAVVEHARHVHEMKEPADG